MKVIHWPRRRYLRLVIEIQQRNRIARARDDYGKLIKRSVPEECFVFGKVIRPEIARPKS